MSTPPRDRRKTNIAAGLACTGLIPSRPAIRNICQRNTRAPFGSRTSPSISAVARRRVAFLVVMRLDHLDIKSPASSGRPRTPFGQLGQQVKRQAHVTKPATITVCFKAASRTVDLRHSDIPVVAYNMETQPACRSALRKRRGSARCGEINNRPPPLAGGGPPGSPHRRCGIAVTDHAYCCAAPWHTGCPDRSTQCPTVSSAACKMPPGRWQNLARSHLAIRPESPCNHYAGCVAQFWLLIRFRFSAW